jgi:hypothetical protein
MSSSRNIARKTKKERLTKEGEMEKWVECDVCERWELFENTGLGGEFDEVTIGDQRFECRMCKLEARMEQQAQERKREGDKLSNIEKEVQSIVSRLDVLEMMMMERKTVEKDGEVKKDGGEESKEMLASELLVRSIVCGDDVKKLEQTVDELKDRVTAFETQAVELNGNDVKKLEQTVDELRDRVTAFETQTEEFKKEWPSIDEWKEIKTSKRMEKAARQSVRLSFAEQFKDKKRDTVVLVGDSLVKGVGQKLEANSHMFSTVCKGGAKIEQISDEISKLENNKERHLVVMVGTNNVQRDYSEVVLDKYDKLLEQCKRKENKVVTMIGIPARSDLDEFCNSRRIGINERLKLKCKTIGVEYLDYECVRSRLTRDGLHMNNLGQDELARRIFTHCKGFLD